MLFLTDQDVQSMLPMQEAIEVMEEAFRQLGLGNVTMPQRSATNVASHKGLMLSMPAYIGGEMDVLGQKVVTIYPENPVKHQLPTVLGLVQLLDSTTGECVAIMEAAALTSIRTGAATAVATKYLATSSSDSIALFGVGGQAEAQIEAVSLVRDVQKIYVYAPTRGHVSDFCDSVSKRLDATLTPASGPKEAIESSDIVVCATNSKTPVFDGAWLSQGMHVNGTGSHTADFRELDTTTIQRSRVVVDSRESALKEAGDLAIPLAEHAISKGQIWAELGEIVAGRKKGRISYDEITVFKSVGLAVQDVVSAHSVYRKAIKENRGVLLD